MDRKLAETQATQIANDLEGPLGRVPMERVIEKHIVFFNDLRSSGATWPQIAELFKQVGITKKNGGAISASQIRATVSRIMSSKHNQKPGMSEDNPPTSPSRMKPKTASFPSAQRNKPQSNSENTQRSLLRERMNQAAKARKQ